MLSSLHVKEAAWRQRGAVLGLLQHTMHSANSLQCKGARLQADALVQSVLCSQHYPHGATCALRSRGSFIDSRERLRSACLPAACRQVSALGPI